MHEEGFTHLHGEAARYRPGGEVTLALRRRGAAEFLRQSSAGDVGVVVTTEDKQGCMAFHSFVGGDVAIHEDAFNLFGAEEANLMTAETIAQLYAGLGSLALSRLRASGSHVKFK